MSTLVQPQSSLTRRHFLGSAVVTGAALALGACSGSDTSDSTGSGWRHTDDLDREIKVPQRPQRVVAYVSSAAALWDFGVRPVGVYGPVTKEGGGKELQAGNIDVDDVTVISNSYTELDLEKLAALKPDLLIASLNGKTAADRWVIKDDLTDKIEKICPIFTIQEAYSPLPEIIASYERLAGWLGADVEGSTVMAAKREFRVASRDLKAALAEKKGLRTEFTYADTDGFYIASPKFYSTLMHYRQLGMTIARQDDSSTEFYEQLSWEKCDKYPVDVVFADERSFSLPVAKMREQPTFGTLPAVRADQIGGWNGEPRFSYQQAAPEIRKVTETIRAARVLS